MNTREIENIQPFVRMVKIKKAVHLEGAWEDLDQLMIYVAKGSLDYIMEGTRYHLEEGDFIIIPPYMYHIAAKSNTDPLVQYIVHFDFYDDPERVQIPHQSAIKLEKKYLIPERERILKDKPFQGKIQVKERFNFEKIFMTMYREYSQRENGYPLLIKGLMLQMLTMLARCQSIQKSGELAQPCRKSKSWKLVEGALEYIYLHYDSELDNERISEAVNASPNYLSKLFQNYIGMSLHSYVLNYRLEKAQQLILSGKCNITEAALCCGFTSVHTFSKAFKQKRGVNPSAYVELMENSELVTLEEQDYDLQKRIYFNQ